jgi:hypothetical protein
MAYARSGDRDGVGVTQEVEARTNKRWLVVAALLIGGLLTVAVLYTVPLTTWRTARPNNAVQPATAFANAYGASTSAQDAAAAYQRGVAALPADAHIEAVDGRDDQFEVTVGEDRSCVTVRPNSWGVSTDGC